MIQSPKPGYCHAAKDGECCWKECPQNRDSGPRRSGRHCPLDRGEYQEGEPRQSPKPGARHNCHNGLAWRYCVACKGRIHDVECTSTRDKRKDCCPARHKMLHDGGMRYGIEDNSVVMWEKS